LGKFFSKEKIVKILLGLKKEENEIRLDNDNVLGLFSAVFVALLPDH